MVPFLKKVLLEGVAMKQSKISCLLYAMEKDANILKNIGTGVKNFVTQDLRKKSPIVKSFGKKGIVREGAKEVGKRVSGVVKGVGETAAVTGVIGAAGLGYGIAKSKPDVNVGDI